MSQRMAEIRARSTAWMDRWWDERVGLVRYPSARGSSTNPYQQPETHLVRESAVYALALLGRGDAGDDGRAARALSSVLEYQIDAPGAVTHGTWRRSPSDPPPGPEPREWIDYDPNWREFIGSAFALSLAHEDALPPALVARMESSLRLACEGSVARAVPEDYTNIALMSAFLLDWAGDRLGESAWRRAGEALGVALADGYAEQGAFPEHNSPTYYGVDLYGAALWRERACSQILRERGAKLEAALWRDLVRFYHAGLRNLCGPYTRAYGMDMTRYVAQLGSWIAPLVPARSAPIPELGDAVAHGHDFFGLGLVGALGSRAPEDARAHLLTFAGPRDLEQGIAVQPARTATARLRDQAMWGGEHTSGRSIHWQHHPATAHWKTPEGDVGWLRLVSNAPVDAVADDAGLDVTIHSGLSWLREADVYLGLELWPEPSAAPDPKAGVVAMPGMTLRVRTEPALSLSVGPGRAGGAARVGHVLAAGTSPRQVSFRIDLEG